MRSRRGSNIRASMTTKRLNQTSIILFTTHEEGLCFKRWIESSHPSILSCNRWREKNPSTWKSCRRVVVAGPAEWKDSTTNAHKNNHHYQHKSRLRINFICFFRDHFILLVVQTSQNFVSSIYLSTHLLTSCISTRRRNLCVGAILLNKYPVLQNSWKQ